MNDMLREELRRETRGRYPEDRFSASADALSEFLFLLSHDSKLKEEDLLLMITGTLSQKKNIAQKWGYIETILKEFYRIREPEAYIADGGTEVKLDRLYKEVFKLVPEIRGNGGGFSLKHATPESCRRLQNTEYRDYPFIAEFVKLYKLRNEGDSGTAHGTDEFGNSDVHSIVTDICVVLLHLSFRYAHDLHQKALLRCFMQELSDTWKVQCDATYQKMLGHVGYVDFRWKAGDICTTEQIALLTSPALKNERYIKLLGKAGSGKTTALLHIQHLLLENYQTVRLIPVFYELKELNDTKEAFLPYLISKQFSVSEEAAKSLLEAGSLIFLLDGYNEILNEQIRRTFALELEKYTEAHPSARVIMTDRNSTYGINVLCKQSKPLELLSLTDDDRADYFQNQKNCPIPEVRKLLLETLQTDSVLFEMLDTPLKLYHFTQMTIRKNCVPDDFIKDYLQELFDRERDAKKDPSIEVLEYYLMAISRLTGLSNTPVAKIEILAIMKKVDDLLGLKDCDTLRALWLARDMGILSEESCKEEGERREKLFYQFEDKEYVAYYNDLLSEEPALDEGL